jgi:hypothetical protein
MNVTLYRAISDAELADIVATERLRAVAASLEGKWFAESHAEAVKWGKALARLSGASHANIVAVEFPEDVAAGLFRLRNLDGIGPARFATTVELGTIISIRESIDE